MPEKKISTWGYEILREGNENVIRINVEDWPYVPSIENNALVMALTIDKLVEVPSVHRIIFVQRKNYVYDYAQTQLLLEIASLYNRLIKQKRALSAGTLGLPGVSEADVPRRHGVVQYIVFNLLRSDPLGAYVEVKRIIREEKIRLGRIPMPEAQDSEQMFIDLLENIKSLLEKTKLISFAKKHLAGYHIGDRSIYALFFRPAIAPDFFFTRLMAQLPADGEQLDVYKVGNAEVNLLRVPDDIKVLYHLNPPEFKLTEDKYELLDLARTVVAEHQPKEEEFLEPEKMRQTFFNIGKDLITELAEQRNMELKYEEIEELTNILVRYTVGFGLIEVLLEDPKVQDIVINGPIGVTPIFLVHSEYEECVTNIIPSRTDAESWASKFRMLSGRPLDEANPVLDTELVLPKARARVAIIQNPLNPFGLAYALRRHRDKPWTLPLFVKNRMISPLGAGLMSFLIDGARTLLIAGTRSSGKTSMLGASLVEIMRKYRIITVEDTLELPGEALRKLGYNIQPMKVRSALMAGGTEVPADEGIRTSLRMGDSSLIVGEIRSSLRGNEEVVVVENGETKRIKIANLENKNLENIFIPTLGHALKVKLTKLTNFVKHPKRKKLLKITTKSNREVTVTHDHSVFTSKNFKVYPIETQKLSIGDQIVLPAKMPLGYNDVDHFNLLDTLPGLRLINADTYIREAIAKLGWKKVSEICNTIDIYAYLRQPKKRANLPIKYFKNLMKKTNLSYEINNFKIKTGTSQEIPAKLEINEDFCRFLGYYIAEGNISKCKTRIQITNSQKTVKQDIKTILKKLNLNCYIRETKGLGRSTQINIACSPLAKLLLKLGIGRVSSEKRIPSFVYGLSERKICALLRGMYTGDGSFTASKSSGNAVRYHTTSKKLAEDVMYLLLTLGIVTRLEAKKMNSKRKRIVYNVTFKQREFIKLFFKKIGFNRTVPNILEKGAEHTQDNSTRFDIKELEKHLKLPRKYRHLRRYAQCSKNYLKKIASETNCSKQFKEYANGEFYLDTIKEIKEIMLPEEEHVYDLSVNPTQNFIGGFGGILLHNTEAFALYEAMRVGALANVVAGTIHGASPYGVFDRVVNDLKVPATSFKATDIILVCNPIKSPDGLKKWKRAMSITEIRKHWTEDPIREQGFVELMKYNSETDQLEPTADLINGESEVLKSIAGNVKEWAGDWDAVWDNVTLRAKIKETLVKYAEKAKDNELLEAEFIVLSNDHFHRISASVKEETGALDSKKIFFEWEEWLKRKIRERKGLIKER